MSKSVIDTFIEANWKLQNEIKDKPDVVIYYHNELLAVTKETYVAIKDALIDEPE